MSQGVKFRQFVEKNNFSIAEVARTLNIRRDTVYAWFEKDELKKKNIDLILESFNVGYDEVFGYNSEIDKEPNLYLVPFKSYAGFLRGYGDGLGTIDNIEKIYYPLIKGEGFAFQVGGQSAFPAFPENTWFVGKPERIGYNRSKTEGKREDSAYISVKVPKEVAELIDRIKITHNTIDLLNKEISLGLISIRKKLGIDKLTMLYARHSFATIARNDLDIPKDDVALALNHVSQHNRITDTYLAPDWSKVDNVQKKVIDYINEDLKD